MSTNLICYNYHTRWTIPEDWDNEEATGKAINDHVTNPKNAAGCHPEDTDIILS
jgi:hypothetical protein